MRKDKCFSRRKSEISRDDRKKIRKIREGVEKKVSKSVISRDDRAEMELEEKIEQETALEELRYRKNELPTGQEVRNIVKFSRITIMNGLDFKGEYIRKKIVKAVKIIAVLIAVSTAIIITAIFAAVSYLK